MIQCPRCGAMAQWGAPACPNCRAPFVAPPTVIPSAIPAQRPASRARIWLGLAGLVALMGAALLARAAFRTSRPEATAQTKPPVTAGLLSVQPSQAKSPVSATVAAGVPEASQGIFRVETQAAQPPVIEIGNGSTANFRLQLQDDSGAIQTEWIPAGDSRQITVKAGHYYARVDAPNNTQDVPAQGEVQVKDFHHYEADFIVGPDNGQRSFYIGD